MFLIDLGAPSHYSVLGVSHDASSKEIRQGKQKVAGELERQRQRMRNPDEKRTIEERITEVNKIGDELSNPGTRADYDKKNVHLTFFAVRSAGSPFFEERRLRMRWVHQAVRDFLVARGASLDPLSDLERSDFSADYTPNSLLDGLLGARSRT